MTEQKNFEVISVEEISEENIFIENPNEDIEMAAKYEKIEADLKKLDNYIDLYGYGNASDKEYAVNQIMLMEIPLFQDMMTLRELKENSRKRFFGKM